MRVGSGAFEGPYSFGSRFEAGTGTNPEEMIGAAHAGCFSMALSAALEREGFVPKRIETTADVHLEKLKGGFTITKIELRCTADVPGVEEGPFLGLAQGAKETCPVSRALAGVEITLEAELV
jgi:osmotically inducible protein OsmC